jgi:hypothetical protein
LSPVTKRYPQTAYDALVKSLQMKWTYLQHIVLGIEGALAPLEEAIQKFFLSAPLEEYAANLTALRPLLGLGVGKAGFGVPGKSDTARGNLIASQLIMGALTESLVERSPLNTGVYSQGASQIQKDCCRDCTIQDKQTLEDLKVASSSLVEWHWMDRATETGAWLTIIPDQLNGTDLSADEFRDSLLLRFVSFGSPSSILHTFLFLAFGSR